MAVKMPDRLSLNTNATKNWKIFRQRWQTYSTITDLNKLGIKKQKATFSYCLDDDALEAYNTFKIDEETTIEQILEMFEKFIVGESNETYERFCFNKRNQEEGETFEMFYADLQRLIKSCNFCDGCQASLLKDRIVLGIVDSNVQRELLKIRKLTLDQTIDICKSSEQASTHNHVLRPEINQIVKPHNRSEKSILKNCKFCGLSHEWRKEKCPAFNKKCNNCNKMNHFSKMCRMKKFDKKSDVNEIEVIERAVSNKSSDDEDEWIHGVGNYNNAKQVKCVLIVDNKPVNFQIDTGSSVNILPRKYISSGNLAKTDTILKTWNKNSYHPIGECCVLVHNPKNDYRYRIKFIICHDEFTPIIGLIASEHMKLIEVKNENFERVHAIDLNNFDDIFDDKLGKFKGCHTLKIKEGSRPYVMPNRKVPIALKSQLKDELDRLVNLGVILPVNEPTEWVSQTVISRKKNGKLRLCLDPLELNKVLIRERYSLPTMEDVLHQMTNSRIFSKMDLTSGYWHVDLDRVSSMLTTFQTCHGRYRFLRLPFGLSVSAEIFQRKLINALKDLEGIVCVADDIIIHGSSMDEHDDRMNKFLIRCRSEGIKLNKEKSEFNVDKISFMGHEISRNGLEVDANKVEAIQKYPVPSNTQQLRCFLGMVNYVSKFIRNMSDHLYPLNNLLKKEVPWTWSTSQDKSFQIIKDMICDSAKLYFYDPSKEVTLENDASDYGIGSVLLQEGKPIAYASRSLSDSERNYAQIEKEMLAIVFGLNKFHYYIYGRNINVTTDHKPLIGIMNKPLNKAPKRIQSMILKIQDYDFNLSYKPGPTLKIADALSRGPLKDTDDVFLLNNLSDHPINSDKLSRIRMETESDNNMIKLRNIIMRGWPQTKIDLDDDLHSYFSYREEMTVENGLILRGERIVIPKSLRYEMKQMIHTGHLGINSCLRRARAYLFWPGMSSDITQYIENCSTCSSMSNKQSIQPLYVHTTPERPWQKIGIDIFSIKNRDYLITVDYFSQYFEVDYLSDITSFSILAKLKAHFARYGLPDTIYSDNGRQLISREFNDFCKKHDIKHETCSPGNSKANGAAEASVKIAKRLMKKCNSDKQDPYMALLNLRNTPQEGMDYSPVQRFMGRRTKTLLPTVPSLLLPSNINTDIHREQREIKQRKMCQKYINRPILKPLNLNDKVRIQPIENDNLPWKEAQVESKYNDRSYIVKTNDGKTYRRDRQHLRKKNPNLEQDNLQTKDPPSTPADHTNNEIRRSTRISRKPDRFSYDC